MLSITPFAPFTLLLLGDPYKVGFHFWPLGCQKRAIRTFLAWLWTLGITGVKIWTSEIAGEKNWSLKFPLRNVKISVRCETLKFPLQKFAAASSSPFCNLRPVSV